MDTSDPSTTSRSSDASGDSGYAEFTSMLEAPSPKAAAVQSKSVESKPVEKKLVVKTAQPAAVAAAAAPKPARKPTPAEQSKSAVKPVEKKSVVNAAGPPAAFLGHPDLDIEQGIFIAPSPPTQPPTNVKVVAKQKSTGDVTFHTHEEDFSSDDNNSNSNSSSGKKDMKSLPSSADNHDSHQDGHGHHAPPSWISLASSSIVCFIIYFVFCIVFSSVVWDPLNSALDTNINPPFGIPQGVGINLMGIAVGSVFFAWSSGCKAVIGGPDLIPVVFFAEAGVSVVTYLAANSKTLGVDCDGFVGDGDSTYGTNADGYGAGEDALVRLLGGEGDSSTPCADAYHRSLGGEGNYLDETSISKVVPTTLVAMMIGNLITGLIFYGLGKMNNTASVIGFIPASVVAGFLTCIGYKV